MRQRQYKTANIPGSLRPSIARALVYLSGVDENDVFMDPMCGAGTILIERALSGKYRLLMGGDINTAAVQATLQNLGSQHKPWQVKQWDATNLPLNDNSVNKIVTNLPWGRQIGGEEKNKILYEGFIKEVSRVLKSGGAAVLLTSQWELLKNLVYNQEALFITRHIQGISVLGWHADIFVIKED